MFDESADLYDAIYHRIKDYAAEASKVRAWIERVRPGARTVLDVACGTGEHARHLARDYEVDGVDLNPAFVRIAQGKNPRGRYHVADMRDFDLGRTYDVVTCLFSSIGYVRTLDALEATLRAFAHHLAPGGVAIVEPWFAPEAWHPERPYMLTIDEPDFKVCRMNISETPAPRTSFFRFHYLVGTREGVRHFTEEHTLGLFTVDETLAAFRAAGLAAQHDPEGVFGRGLYVARRA